MGFKRFSMLKQKEIRGKGVRVFHKEITSFFGKTKGFQTLASLGLLSGVALVVFYLDSTIGQDLQVGLLVSALIAMEDNSIVVKRQIELVCIGHKVVHPSDLGRDQVVLLDHIKPYSADINLFDNLLEELVKVFGYGTLRDSNSRLVQKRLEVQRPDRSYLY